MTTDPAILLARLEPAVRPAAAADAAAAAGGPFETRTFSALLADAARGRLPTGRPVRVACDPQAELCAADLLRLSAAADLAEASGARRALLLLDGRGLVLDVASRQVHGELTAAAPWTRIDAAVLVPGGGRSAGRQFVRLPSGVPPPAVGRTLDALRPPRA
jgi:hypothetical protein